MYQVHATSAVITNMCKVTIDDWQIIASIQILTETILGLITDLTMSLHYLPAMDCILN